MANSFKDTGFVLIHITYHPVAFYPDGQHILPPLELLPQRLAAAVPSLRCILLCYDKDGPLACNQGWDVRRAPPPNGFCLEGFDESAVSADLEAMGEGEVLSMMADASE